MSMLSAAQLKTWMRADLSKLYLSVIQIDGIRIERDLILLVGVDAEGNKRPLGEVEGVTENALRRSLACTNVIENLLSKIRRMWRNVKHWWKAAMALR